MRLSPSRSMSAPMLSHRERRTIAIGAVVSTLALLVAYGVLPIVRGWQERESLIAAEATRLAQLRGLVASEGQLAEVVAAGSALLDSGPRRLLAGRTSALAAAALQSTLQSYADRGLVTVSRLDVAGAPDSTDRAIPVIPATLSALGDIHGVTELLFMIRSEPLHLEIEELILRPNPALRGELLQVTLTLRAPYLLTDLER